MTYDELHKQLDEEYDRIIAETLRQLAKKKPLTRQKLAKALFEANKKYWTARLALLDDSAVYDAERIGRIVGTAYSNAAIELSDQVRRVFSGYQSAFNLTRKDAEDLLEHVVYDRSIADNLRTMAAAVPNSEEKTRIMAELSAPAYRYRMQRAEQIAKNAQETLESIAKFEVRTDRTFMQTEIEKAYNISLDEAQRLPPSDAVIIDLSGQSPQNTGYMPRAEEPVRDFTPTTDRGIMDSFTLVNDKAVKEIIDHEWKDGNFSERIWSNTDELAREVKQVLLEGELTGASEAKMAAKIEERFQVGMHKARRVIRTESNYCINQSELKGMKDAGFDEYEFISLGEEAEDVCDTCDDLDGQRFRISEAAVGVNCPPMHPFCRCKVTTPQETLEDIQADIDRMLEGTSIDEIEQRLDMMIEEQEAAENSAEGVDNSENSGIIKSITVEDITSADSNGDISEDCKRTIADTLGEMKKSGHDFYYDDVSIVNIPEKNGSIEPLRTNCVDRAGNTYTVLEINKAAFVGRTKEDIDILFLSADNTVCNSLEDAVKHEVKHAETIFGRTYANYERINEELQFDAFKKPIVGREDKKSIYDLAGDVSKLAQKDGLECIAECGVLIERGEAIDDDLRKFHDLYTSGGG